MENIRVIYSRIAIYLFLSINTFFEQISNEDDKHIVSFSNSRIRAREFEIS